MSISDSDYKTPFAVEFCNDVNAEECGNCRYFTTLADAQKLADLQSERFAAVWLSEVGSYDSRLAKGRRTDWIYFWWSKRVAESDTPPNGRGTGYPNDYPKQWVSYTPFAQ